MNKLRCCFCQQEYIITKDDSCFGQQRCVCRNPNCEFDGWHFPIKLVSELIRTRKVLDIAIHRLNQIAEHDCDRTSFQDMYSGNFYGADAIGIGFGHGAGAYNVYIWKIF